MTAAQPGTRASHDHGCPGRAACGRFDASGRPFRDALPGPTSTTATPSASSRRACPAPPPAANGLAGPAPSRPSRPARSIAPSRSQPAATVGRDDYPEAPPPRAIMLPGDAPDCFRAPVFSDRVPAGQLALAHRPPMKATEQAAESRLVAASRRLAGATSAGSARTGPAMYGLSKCAATSGRASPAGSGWRASPRMRPQRLPAHPGLPAGARRVLYATWSSSGEPRPRAAAPGRRGLRGGLPCGSATGAISPGAAVGGRRRLPAGGGA
jgi:hypothetical protein